ncbi:hypothetical protein [Qipengyuania nanhaisediminis]|uniref:hypothetical protein n=1 Tax=Qipengyuania nanhaisediminis TaxID=604088 RepID=UPI0038B29EB1
MRLTITALAVTAALGLAGCDTSPSQDEAGSQAIALDEAVDVAGDEVAGPGPDDEVRGDGESAPGADGAQARPARSGTSGSTMESGSNADGGRTGDPARSKLQPAD